MNVVEVAFTELLSEIVDNRGRTCPTAEKGLPLIATNCIKNDGLYPIYETERYVDAETYEGWFRGHPEPGDILFVCKGSPGLVALVPEPVDFCIAQDMVALRADASKVYPNYLFTVLRAPHIRYQIYSMHVGSLIPHFKKGDFHKLRIPIPSESEQRFIGDTYVELSQKIESNRRIISTALGIIKATQRQISEYKDSRIGSVGELAQQLQERVQSNDHVIVMSAIASGELVSSDEFFKKQVYSKRIDKYLLVPKWAFAYNPSRINIGSIGLNDSEKVGAVSPVYVVAKANSRREARWLQVSLQSSEVKDQISAFSSGSVRQVLRYPDFASIQLKLPSINGFSNFDTETQSLFDLIEISKRQSRALEITRDTLLPELLSGRIRVRDAESIVEDAL